MGLLDFLKHKKKTEKAKDLATKKDTAAVLKEPLSRSSKTAPSILLGRDIDAGLLLLLEKPHITEKATDLAEQGKYVFKVMNQANKTEIKKVIERLYKVKIESVNILNMPSKIRRVGRNVGHLAGFKKAIVSLQKGHKIDIFSQ